MPHLVAFALTLSPLPVIAGWSSPDYRVRDRLTEHAARRFGPADAAWRWSDTLVCPECRHRAELARRRAICAALARLGPFPCADSCWYDVIAGRYDETRPANPLAVPGLRAALDDTGRDAYPHALYRQATRTFVASELRAGCREVLLVKLLVEMRRRDAAYYAKQGLRVPY